jgi:hypothetical protein
MTMVHACTIISVRRNIDSQRAPSFFGSGRPELNIKPWEALQREINEANAVVNWTDRAPYAYWKGNPKVGAERLLLLRCNASGERDWNARVYAQVHSSLNPAGVCTANTLAKEHSARRCPRDICTD